MTDTTTAPAPAGVEANGLNVIDESERHGSPATLFWPWFASNISVLAISYGSFVLGFGISFWQALAAAVIGIVASFLLCGFVSLAGKRGSAPTLVLSRAAFGVRGNKLPAALSWILTVGWETVLVVLATLATSTVFERLGWGGGTVTKLVALLVVAAVTVFAGVFGFAVIMRLQTFITIATAVLTIVYMVLAADHIHWSSVTAAKSGGFAEVVGACVLVITALGLGWVNCAADYSRYLPRTASSAGVVGWTTFGAALGPMVLVIFGLLLAGSDPKLADAVGADPIGALTGILPTWSLIPFLLVALLGLIAGAVLDIYSSGLSLLSLGLPAPRWVAALIDGTIMTVGAIVVVFFADDFLGPFQAFLVTIGVPIAAWCGIFLGDLARRRGPYDDQALYDARGRYGSVNPIALALLVIGTAVGWGLVTSVSSSTDWLTWQGYLLEPFGLGGKTGLWAGAGLGVLAALAIGFVGTLFTWRGDRGIAKQTG
ncbi:purine-cytosine permease family protein [Flexivirga meconopsidis]|uniref:purine-cytosine permease family protein n=1 Tax=Flexivirga meconopsidis TaxID=2977121 RepID=UPI00223F974C|nr:cytosine permease [Flexivirga meconopsidis]